MLVKLQQFHVLKHSCEINFPAYSVTLCTSLKIIDFSSILVEINKTLSNSKKDELTNSNTALQEKFTAEINKTPNASNEDESTNENDMLQEEVISVDKK